MKIKNIQDLDLYPENYYNVQIDTQMKIINFMNGMQQLAQRYFKRYFEEGIDNKSNKFLQLYQQTMDSLSGAKSAYATLGIMVEYNWPHWKGMWDLATREDAEFYQNYDGEIPSDESLIKELLDYGDIQ